MRATLAIFDAVDIGPQHCSVILGALVVATDILWHLLVVVEHGVRLAIPADDGVQPELLHEEDLVGEVLGAPCVCE